MDKQITIVFKETDTTLEMNEEELCDRLEDMIERNKDVFNKFSEKEHLETCAAQAFEAFFKDLEKALSYEDYGLLLASANYAFSELMDWYNNEFICYTENTNE